MQALLSFSPQTYRLPSERRLSVNLRSSDRKGDRKSQRLCR